MGKAKNYVIADLIGPCLCIIDIVAFVLEMLIDDLVDFPLDEGSNVVEDNLFLFGHAWLFQILIFILNPFTSK